MDDFHFILHDEITMPVTFPHEIRVSIDVGCHQHSVSIALPDGQLFEEFNIEHKSLGFKHFIQRVDYWEKSYQGSVSVAMEGYNGYASPLDKLIQMNSTRE